MNAENTESKPTCSHCEANLTETEADRGAGVCDECVAVGRVDAFGNPIERDDDGHPIGQKPCGMCLAVMGEDRMAVLKNEAHRYGMVVGPCQECGEPSLLEREPSDTSVIYDPRKGS